MVKIMTILFLAACVMGIVLPVYAQDEPQQVAVSLLSGEVVSVDLTNSTIEVKTVTDPVAGTCENIVLAVTPGIQVTKGDVVLGFSDLKAGDKVAIEWTDDEAGNPVAQRIVVE